MRYGIRDELRKHLAKEGTGKFAFPSRGKTGIIYVPSDVVKDSTFPLEEKDPLLIRIEGDHLVIEKAKKR
jgi:hypothetical protein